MGQTEVGLKTIELVVNITHNSKSTRCGLWQGMSRWESARFRLFSSLMGTKVHLTTKKARGLTNRLEDHEFLGGGICVEKFMTRYAINNLDSND